MLYRGVLRPLLFALDAEFAHETTISLLSYAARLAALAPTTARTDPKLQSCVAGITFPNPVGLAAGCDKNARALPVWARLGFGFIETGTVTAQPQPGNPRPRVFRYPRLNALVNRLGFNSEGSLIVAERLRRLRAGRPSPVPIAVNIGKTRAVTGDDAILEDYRTVYRRVAPYADLIVVNVSSPNTPGLRQWQEKGRLQLLLETIVEEGNTGSQGTPPPLFVKISPDMADGDMADVAEVVLELGLAGIIASNTTISREGAAAEAQEVGGLSGSPLCSRAEEVVRFLYSLVGRRVPLIGVGGIATPEDAYRRIRSGASLIQCYTGLIYQGPLLPRTLNAGLLRLMGRDGVTNVADIVGADV